MDNLFYEKYLKYKAKYLALGGTDTMITVLESDSEQSAKLYKSLKEFTNLIIVFIEETDSNTKNNYNKLIKFDEDNNSYTLLNKSESMFDYNSMWENIKSQITQLENAGAVEKDMYNRTDKLIQELTNNSYNDSVFYYFIHNIYTSLTIKKAALEEEPAATTESSSSKSSDDNISKLLADTDLLMAAVDSKKPIPAPAPAPGPAPGPTPTGSGNSSGLGNLTCTCELFNLKTK